MHSRLSGIALLTLAVMLLLPASSMAHDRGRGNKWKRQPRVVYRHNGDWGWRYYLIGGRYYGPYRQGWDCGRKVGWGNCDLPPGLAKKYGCNGAYYRTDRFYRGYPVVSVPLDDRGRFRLEFRGGY
ncbi:MAG: hypothetical protein L0099_07590 [Acidobacteria bacterium]|nr:hypothetical protein [Acidobacteriota bacterium]